MNPPLLSAEGLSGLVFLVVLATTVTGALIAVSGSRLIRSVAGLAVSFLGVAGLYYYLESPFISMMEILIYVGAICVTIVFAVMLADPVAKMGNKSGALTAILGLCVSVPIFWGLATLARQTNWRPAAIRAADGSMEAIGRHLLTTYSFVFELISVVLLVAIIGALVVAREGRGE